MAKFLSLLTDRCMHVVSCRALESFCRCLMDWGWVSPRRVPPRMDIILFAAGCGAIVHCYSGYNGLHRDVFKSKYLNVLDFVFGNTGVQGGCSTWSHVLCE